MTSNSTLVITRDPFATFAGTRALQNQKEECGLDEVKHQVLCLQCESHAIQDSAFGQCFQIAVRVDGGVQTMYFRCCLTVSDLIFRLSRRHRTHKRLRGREMLVYSGTRLLHPNDMLATFTTGFDAGCCLDIYECLDGGGCGCSRVGIEDQSPGPVLGYAGGATARQLDQAVNTLSDSGSGDAGKKIKNSF
jgi:hypothetical protein